MKLLFTLPLLSLAAGLGFALAPLAGAHEITYRQDRDHDGHYVTKHLDVRRGGYDRGRYGRGGYYGGGYFGGFYARPYFGGGGYPYYYGGYPDYYDGPSVSYSYPTRPASGYADYANDLGADVQRALKRRGYYGGSLDGDIGPASREALRHYQSEHRLDVTGRIDRGTLRSLGID